MMEVVQWNQSTTIVWLIFLGNGVISVLVPVVDRLGIQQDSSGYNQLIFMSSSLCGWAQ